MINYNNIFYLRFFISSVIFTRLLPRGIFVLQTDESHPLNKAIKVKTSLYYFFIARLFSQHTTR